MNPPLKPPRPRKLRMGKNAGGVLGDVLGVGAGAAGFVRGMTHSAPAQAAVTDETRTRAYRDAQAAVRAGRGDAPTRGDTLWGALTKTGPTPNETLKAADQRQAAFDKKYRSGGPP